MSTNVTKENLQEFATKLHAKNKTIFASKTDVGTPLVASTAAGMTDTSKIYVYTGSETGYTAGNWYYYNGSAWASGGVYNAEAIETDETLSVSGMAADAKAVGDEFAKDLWGVPLAVREAIYTLLNSAAYATTGLTDEIAVVETWAEEVYSLSLSASTLSLDEDTPQALIATVVPATASVSWSSSDTSVATVTAGVVTGASNGSCTITAVAGSLSATCAVTVSGFPELESISAVYTQSGTVFPTDSLDSLKADLVVTATYSDTSTATIPSTDYTLSGTLTVGTNTITVTYQGKTTTFTVTVDGLYKLSSTFTSNGTNYIDTGVAFGLNKQYTVVCTFAISTFQSSTANPTSACVFGDMHGESSNYNALNEQKVSGGGNAGTYCWGNGLSWAESKNFVSENNTIKYVLTFDISSTGSTKDWYIKNVTQSTSKSGTLTSTNVLSIKGYNVFIGKQETSGGSPGFIGTMSDFKIYDRILTADEITAYLG